MKDAIAIGVRITPSRVSKGVWIAAPIKRAYLDERSIFFIGQGLSPSSALKALTTIYKAKSGKDILPILVEGQQ